MIPRYDCFLPERFSILPASGVGDLESQVLQQMKHPSLEAVKTIQAWVQPLTLQCFLYQLARMRTQHGCLSTWPLVVLWILQNSRDPSE